VQHQSQSSRPVGPVPGAPAAPVPAAALTAGARHGFSVKATRALWTALVQGNGGMAQFSHPELGGLGQWVRGGMTMVGDMFNHDLAARVGALCGELAELVAAMPPEVVAAPSALAWWPAGWGSPSVRGGQDDHAYAWFAQRRRLAIRRGGQVDFFDTADHRITGASQQQGSAYGLAFTSQLGTVNVAQLRRVRAQEEEEGRRTEDVATQPAALDDPSAKHRPQDIFDALARLAQLHQQGILTDEEFHAKKTQLLARL